MMRRTPMKRSRMRRRHKSTKYSRRERDFAYLRFCKLQLCAVEEERPDPDREPTPCEGVIEADHMGARGLGQKCPDNEACGICAKHHRERTDHSGSFKWLTKIQCREWRERAIARTQRMYEESK